MVPAAVIVGTPATANGSIDPLACGEEFSGGSGTDSDPYLVSTPQDLTDLNGDSNCWGNSFLQTANIDMGSDQWTTTTGTDPDEGTAFSGTYDGGNFMISNLDIDVNDDYVGLFGYVTGDIRNVNLDETNSVTGENNVGALVGRLRASGTVTNSSSAVDVVGVDTAIGGLVGTNYGTISDSHATGNVTGSGDQEEMGGLIGRQRSTGRVSNSYATGNVTGIDNVGGLIGEGDEGSVASGVYATGLVTGRGNTDQDLGGLLGENAGTLTNCYATGEVDQGGDSGGLVGENTGSGTVSNCYSTGEVDAETVGTDGGLVAVNSGSVSSSFWDTVTSDAETSAGGTGKTTAELKTLATFTDAGWSITESCDATTIWGLCSTRNSGYPYLTFYTAPTTPSDTFVQFTFSLPDGRECTSISPVQVRSGSQYRLPDGEALCKTTPGSKVIGWTIPVPAGFTGAGSSSLPFSPGHLVDANNSQQFTAVIWEPVIEFRYDANVGAGIACEPGEATHTSHNGHLAHIWVPRETFSDARFPTTTPCTPPGHELQSWNTAGNGTGQSYTPGNPLPEAWATTNPNTHTLYAIWRHQPAS